MGHIVTVEFHGDTLLAVQRGDAVFVAITPICKALGVDAKKQRERIQRDIVLGEGGAVMAFPSPGGTQDTFCLRLDMLNGWLFGIDDSRVATADIREKVLAYKRECYAVLARHFLGETAPHGGALPDDGMRQEAARKLVTEARHSFSDLAARQLWFKLGLPTVPAMHAAPYQPSLFTYTAERG